MVCLTEKPSFCEASCCKVEVIKGDFGERLEGFFSMLLTLNVASNNALENSSASSFVAKSLSSFASTNSPVSFTKSALILKVLLTVWSLISLSLSTTKRTTGDCTLPADFAPETFFHRTPEISKPTKRSITRLACCASTTSKFTVLGCWIAFVMAPLVISWKTIRGVSFGKFKASNKCQAIASPSRSSSVAR